MTNSLRIMSWNANGLIRRKKELEVVLNMEKIDICLIAETHLTNSTFVNFANYQTYCTNHPQNNARGGSAIIIKSNIKHHEEANISLNEFQITTVSVTLQGSEVLISAIYSPPRHNIKFELYKNMLDRYKRRFIIGGDFNAKNTHWGSRLTTTKGRELLKAANSVGCEILSTGKPTYWPTDTNKKPDLIDFFIVKQMRRSSLIIKEGYDLNSDHSPIYMVINECLETQRNQCQLTNNHTDWLYFRYLICREIDVTSHITSIEDLEVEVKLLTQIIQYCAWSSTPEMKTDLSEQKYPQYILDLIKLTRKTRNKWQQLRQPALKTKLNYLSKRLKKKIWMFENSFTTNKIINLTADKDTDYSLYKFIKSKNKPIKQNFPLKNSDGVWIRHDKGKAEAFAIHLSRIFQPIDTEDELIFSDAIQSEEKITLFTSSDVLYEIENSIKPKKCPGFDRITVEILKNLPHIVIAKITDIINACIRLKYVPTFWKMSEIIMIPKPGKDPYEVSSYRPISLLPTISKLFERLFIKRLKQTVENRRLIPNHQFGFRENHSTLEQIHRITSVIEEALEEKKVCSAVFLDVAQAFDKVWHLGLVKKLQQILPKQYTDIIRSYLEERYFVVKVKDEISELYPINSGVPQGSILGPLLYLLYTSDMPVPPNCTVATFADDTCLLATGCDEIASTQKLQEAVNKIAEWSVISKLQLNERKSIHINFTNKNITNLPIFISNNQIPYSNNAKYLGMTLDAKLKWKEHVKKKTEELNIKYRNLKWLIGKKSKLSIKNKLLVYNQNIKPIWTYGIQLYGCASKKQIESIQKFQNKVLRNIVNAPWYIRNNDLHNELGVKSVAETIKLYATKHSKRLHEHTNPNAAALNDVSRYTRRLKRTKPHDLIPYNH